MGDSLLTSGSMMMGGTSPANFNFPRSPSLHSSSYLPKMETNFLRDYSCCGQTLDSLHELLQHFEENHAQQSSTAAQRSSISSQGGIGNRRPSNGMNQADSSRGFTGFDQPRQPQQPRSNAAQNWGQRPDTFTRTQLATVQDLDTIEDMDMNMDLDDTTLPPAPLPQHRMQFGQPPSNMAQLNTQISAPPTFGKISTPTTPSANQAFSLFSNPTVSSVNTPAMNTQILQQSQTQSPNASIPGTPAAEMDPNFTGNFMGGIGAYSTTGDLTFPDNLDFGDMSFGNLANNVNELTITDPAKRLYSKQGGLSNQQLQYAMKNGQVPMDSELAKRLREQQLVGGLGGPIVGFNEPETKPFKCPVIGCEKAYKNQNGLKYHKQVNLSSLHYL
jgi:transcription factor SFP1